MYSNYDLNDTNEFVIQNYTQQKPFSSFLPSISGLHGKPMWVFYVNRGQCIASMGINNKNHSILEFVPANKAYRQTSLHGFRTFLKVKDNGKQVCYEPFQDSYPDPNISRSMYITSYDLKLEEVNNALGIKISVMYCTLPSENLSGLLRRVEIANISENPIEIEVLDGVPILLPYFVTDEHLKVMSNLSQAWMKIENADTVPFYKLNTLTADSSEIIFIEGGNFYLNFSFDIEGSISFSKTAVDPTVVFGNNTNLVYAENFFGKEFTMPENQASVGFTPCGFGHKKVVIDSGESDTTYTILGNSDKYEKLLGFVNHKLSEEYITSKIDENKCIVESLKSPIFTASSSKEFDLYCGQTFLDNVLRGGYPVQLGKGKNVFYVYSRRHGDLEREYNFFQIDSTYYSQGNSNFRDVNQNRRSDVCFFPFTGDTNIKIFFDLLQLDGFNPLVLKGSHFKLESEVASEIVKSYVVENQTNTVMEFLRKPFTPGSLMAFIEDNNISLSKGTSDEFMDEILYASTKEDLADFGEGYWSDHWTYNSDLLESYISIFPDKIVELMFAKYEFTYFDTDHLVMPRDKKYVLTEKGIRQYNSITKIADKAALINSRVTDKNKVCTNYGTGEIYKCSLASKIVTLLVNKLASLDPEGVGVEMDGGKPGWCDALNGLPGILGSAINESVEVKRLARILLDLLSKATSDTKVALPVEVYDFFNEVCNLLESSVGDFEYWDRSYSAKEIYRGKTLFGISGEEKEIDGKTLENFLNLAVSKIDSGLKKAFNSEDNMYYTFFINEVVEYETITDGEKPHVKALKFKQRPIPYFLEGLVHVLRTENDIKVARKLYKSIEKSELYDKKLEMYKVNVNIMDETKEIGRQNTFPRGWLENEAIFLHMAYKYILELLKKGLNQEFLDSFYTGLVPFFNPAEYGRSILENSSFIASTVHPDERTHGTGYVSRLTGASSELLSMWFHMNAGPKPFYLDGRGKLCLEFKPMLPSWLFTTKEKTVEFYRNSKLEQVKLPANTFAFMFLGKTLVVYHNKKKEDTYGRGGVKVDHYSVQCGRETSGRSGRVIKESFPQMVRDGLVDRIDLHLE